MKSPSDEQIASTQTTAPSVDTTLVPGLPDEGNEDSGSAADEAVEEVQTMSLFAPWGEGATVVEPFKCGKADSSPALQWSGVPEGVTSLAIVLTDEDAPDYVHWVVANIAPNVTGIAAGGMPAGAIQATNSAGNVGYAGPCPPDGKTHEYSLTLYALDQMLEFADGDPGTAMQEAVYASAIEATSVTFRA
jgi:Raf kinase inhibitor-like YbhB/YbcL family protein